MAGAGIHAANRAHHFRGEQDVVHRNDLGQQVDARLVVDAGVEVNVVEQELLQRRFFHVLRQTAIASPVIRHRAAAVRNDEFQGREILEDVRCQELHEGGGVAVDVVRARRVEVRIAGAAHVDHGGNFKLHHLFVNRIPPAVEQGRIGPHAAGRIGVEVQADEAEFLDATLEFGNAVLRRHPGRLRQLADTDEILRIEADDPVDQLIAMFCPVLARGFIANVVSHTDGAGRKDGDVRAAFALHLQLRALQALADLVVGDAKRTLGRNMIRILQALLLGLAVRIELLGGGGVVAVTIDNHACLFSFDYKWVPT